MATVIKPASAKMTDQERQALRDIGACTADETMKCSLLIQRADGKTIALPEPLADLLRQAAQYLTHDQAVSLVAFGKDLTTQQAADLLNVSRPYLVKLLESGAIPFTRTGSHRRVFLGDVLEYKRRRDAERRVGLAELTQMGQEFGLDE